MLESLNSFFFPRVGSDFSVSPKLLLIQNSIFMSKLHPELLQVLPKYRVYNIFSYFHISLTDFETKRSYQFIFKTHLLEHLCCLLDNSLDFV